MKNIDFKKLVIWLTPLWLRKGNPMLLVLSFNWPLRQLYNFFLIFYAAKMYRLTHNSQVCYLQAVLRDSFDAILRRIWIGDFDGKQRLYFWPEADSRDIDFSTDQYFYADSDYADSGIDFTIHLPVDVVTTSAQMAYLKSLVNEYKLAGKNYNIERF